MNASSPRSVRIRSLRRLDALPSDLERELARLEQMPWPSGRSLAYSRDPRLLERRVVPLVRDEDATT
jgi:hypothetical protein